MDRELEIGVYRHFKHGDLYRTFGKSTPSRDIDDNFKFAFFARREDTGVLYPIFKNEADEFIIVGFTIEGVHIVVCDVYCIYQALYGEGIYYIRDLAEFLSPVDSVKYPNYEQSDRFKYISDWESFLKH